MDLILAKHNPHKAAEMTEILSALSGPDGLPYRVLTAKQIGITEEPEETGETFEENARIKAAAIAAHGYIAVADDSGLQVDALGGDPGVHSARYSGGGPQENNEKLLLALQNVPDEKRTAHFATVIVCLFPDGKQITAAGQCDGQILRAPRGTNGFGYDPLFYYPPKGKTFAELSSEEKNAVSHRGRAMRDFASQLAVWTSNDRHE